MLVRLFVVLACLLQLSCHGNKTEAKITLYPKIGIDEKIYLFKVPFNGESILVDSVIVKNNTDPVSLTYPNAEEGVYELSSSFNNFKIKFISDNPDLTIHIDYFSRTYTLNSRATNSLIQLNKLQQPHSKEPDSTYHRNLLNYEDTVKSPAAFVMVYSQLDFGKDLKSLKRFFASATKRFPAYQPVKDIKDRALAFIKIMEEEYVVGDQLPVITLPDRDGNPYSTAKLKGKLYFIDFWSTFCPDCVAYTSVKKQAINTFPKDKFGMVSIALDPELITWNRFVDGEKLNWPQLIDQKMWEGDAVKTLKFDSIPANFLVSAQGRVLAKAIPKDSLIATIRRFLKD